MRGGGGGVCWARFRSGPISVGGGRGSKRSAPLFPGPQGEPAHGLHPRFVVAEIWADRAGGGGGGLPTCTSPSMGKPIPTRAILHQGDSGIPAYVRGVEGLHPLAPSTGGRPRQIRPSPHGPWWTVWE